MDNKTLLLKQERKVFSIDDLALIWKIENRNTLRVTISRYVKEGALIPIKRGLYSIAPLDGLDPFLVGTSYVKGFCYVSLQTVLAIHGLINQNPQAITLVGGRSQEFKVGEERYICRKMKPAYLYNLEGIDFKKDYVVASAERAIADMLYFNAKFHFDAEERIDWNEVEKIKKKVFL